MRLVYPSAKEFAYIVDAVAALVDEAEFVVRRDGLYLRMLDMSRTAMVDLAIPREAFEEFPDVEELRVGLNLKDLMKILRRIKKGDKIAIEPGEGRVRVKLVGKSTRSVALRPVELIPEEMPRPKFTVAATLRVTSAVLLTMLRDVAVVGDEVRFEASIDAFVAKGVSDRGEVEVRLERGSEFVYGYEVREPASAKYSLDYLLKMAQRGAKISDVATLEFATARPVALTFDLPSGVALTYFLAPRVE